MNTETLTFTTTNTTTLDTSTLSASPEEVGTWMLAAAERVWGNYNDNGTFESYYKSPIGTPEYERVWFFNDPDEGKTLSITPREFFEAHVRLIWLAQIEGYRHDWIEFAFKSHDAEADEYDDNTVDAVFQTLMYGEVVYG